MGNTYKLLLHKNIDLSITRTRQTKVLLFHIVLAVFIISTNTLYEQHKTYLTALVSYLELSFHKTHQIQKPCPFMISQ